MTVTELRATLADADPPNLSPELSALWHDGKGNWARAHQIAQDIAGATGAWIHAYLHRKEGDLDNARYWYHRAGRRPATGPLEAEWTEIAGALLDADA